ncbi:hypothetical protein [Klebsiella pneumoniae]|uniref:hypothetical protein n=1 Tax=Klebsiella pneumoniae TaxID=573 RepID=UPI003008FC08
MHRVSARPVDGFWRSMPPPSLPPKRALAPPPRLRAARTSFCALCADLPGPASAGATQQKRGFKNCAKLCKIVHVLFMIVESQKTCPRKIPYNNVKGKNITDKKLKNSIISNYTKTLNIPY